jgi:hypothetical protein
VNDLMSLLLDLANIVGGFLLAIGLLLNVPRIGDDLGKGAAFLAPFSVVVGIVALVAGGYFLLVHLTDGPHIFYFELVGIGVGVALLWDRLRGPSAGGNHAAETGRSSDSRAAVGTKSEAMTGTALLLAIFGIIAIVVGLQGLFTPN